MRSNHFFITGMARSGTTLLDKLLDSHHSLSVLSQPFPMLYRRVKTDFLKSINYPSTYYVLNDLFNQHFYKPGQFLEYLQSNTISKSVIRDTFSAMKDWSGQYTKVNDVDKLLEQLDEGELADILRKLTEVIAGEGGRGYGTKETLVEEFIPYYISCGIKVILIIRDPRDVITSLNFGKGTEYGGQHRPTLFHIRNWRKSIALANTFMDSKMMLSIRYEDLLNNQTETLGKICRFLDVENFKENHFEDGIRTSGGKTWEGNSSTGQKSGIDSANFAKYKKFLSEQQIHYIEQMCAPEMLTIGYKPDVLSEVRKFNKPEFTEPFRISADTNLDPLMSSSDAQIELEKKRYELLKSDIVLQEGEIVPYFYSMPNYLKLREAIV